MPSCFSLLWHGANLPGGAGFIFSALIRPAAHGQQPGDARHNDENFRADRRLPRLEISGLGIILSFSLKEFFHVKSWLYRSGVDGQIHCAEHPQEAGFSVTVHSRSRAAVDELAAEGAAAANSPREVAEQTDIVFTNLPDLPDVEKVVLDDVNGMTAGSRPGMIVVDNSTIKPASLAGSPRS